MNFSCLTDRRCICQVALTALFISGFPARAELPAPSILSPEYGQWVDIDGDTAVVSAYAEPSPLGAYVGAVYVFRRSGTTWVQEARLTSTDPAANEQFGRGVAVDGDVIAVGVAFDNTLQPGGSVQLFRRFGTTWQIEGRLLPSEPQPNFAEIMSMDNGALAIGRTIGNGPGGQLGAGCVLLYRLDNSFGNIPQTVYANDAAAGDAFGFSVALEGEQMVVGAPFSDPSGKPSAGAVYVFDINSFFTNQTAKLTALNGGAGDVLGSSVAIQGNRVIGGAPGQMRGDRQDGAAYIFVANPAWQQEAVLVTPAQTFFNTALGSKVGLSRNYAVVASEFARPFGGRFQVYRRIGTTWLRTGILAPDFSVDTRFPAMAITENQLLAGFPIYDVSGGAAAVYQIWPRIAEPEIAVYTGVGPALREVPASMTLNFGDAWINENQSWPLTVYNDGSQALVITAAELAPGGSPGVTLMNSGGFPNFFINIAPGETGVLTLSTDFSVRGNQTGALTISSNDPDEPTFTLPFTFNAVVRPPPPGLTIQRIGNFISLRYPPFNYTSFRVERSITLTGPWQDLGPMSPEFDINTLNTIMAYQDFNAPAGRAFYRIRVN